MSPLPYSADSQTEATCHYRQPFRIYASDIYCDANITFLSQTRNKTDVFFGVFHSFVNPPPTCGTHGATMACRGRRARPTPKPTVVGMPPKANENAGIRQGLPSGVAKRAVPPCKTAHAALPNGTYRKAERPVLQRQGGQPRNPLQARQLGGSARIMAIFYKNATPAAAPTPAALSPATVPAAPHPCFAR